MRRRRVRVCYVRLNRTTFSPRPRFSLRAFGTRDGLGAPRFLVHADRRGSKFDLSTTWSVRLKYVYGKNLRRIISVRESNWKRVSPILLPVSTVLLFEMQNRSFPPCAAPKPLQCVCCNRRRPEAIAEGRQLTWRTTNNAPDPTPSPFSRPEVFPPRARRVVHFLDHY